MRTPGIALNSANIHRKIDFEADAANTVDWEFFAVKLFLLVCQSDEK